MPENIGYQFQMPSFQMNAPAGGGFQSLPSQNNDQGGFFSKGGGYQNVMSGLNALSGVAGAYTGLQQLKLGQEAFDFNKQSTQANFANQAQTVNTQLEDRQRARLASNPNAYQALDQYMAANSVNGTIGT